MDSKMNYYELLGVERTASKEEIQKAYKNQMKKWHPDINKSSEAPKMAMKLNEAKAILLDDDKRRSYDLSLDQDINESYNKYTGREQTNNYTNTQNSHTNTQTDNTDDDMVTKWEYLKEYMKYSKDPLPRKLLAWIGVYLGTFLCFLIKIVLIGFAYLSSAGSNIILSIFSRLFPFACLILVFLMYLINDQGFDKVMETNGPLAIGIAIFFGLYVLGLFLPILARAILSPKTFYVLYNKIDITLFKWCVGYKD